jgi:hypothetical protein
MMAKEIINVKKIFSNIFNFFEYTIEEKTSLEIQDYNEFTNKSLNEMQEWKVPKKALCYSFFRLFENIFHQGKYVTICRTAEINDRGKQYYLSLQREIDENFEKYCRQLDNNDLQIFSLFELENEYVSSLALFEQYYSSLPEFKLAKYSYITDGNKELIFQNRSENNFKCMYIDINKIFPRETEIFENIFDNRISEYLVSKYLKNGFGEDISTTDYLLLTYESEPVFELFFASKASFIVFKETILPENGEQISRVKLWLIFDFFRDNKLRYQRGISSETPMGCTKEQREFIKAINPFFNKKYKLDIRIDNVTPAANKEYPIMKRLDKQYEKMENKLKEINNY